MSNKTSDENVVQDIEYLKSDEAEQLHFIGNPRLKNAIKNILAELEQKDKRIKELEEENRIFALEGSKIKLELYIKENYIPKQAITEAISVHQNYLLNQTFTGNSTLDAHFRDKERYAIQVLQDFLECVGRRLI